MGPHPVVARAGAHRLSFASRVARGCATAIAAVAVAVVGAAPARAAGSDRTAAASPSPASLPAIVDDDVLERAVRVARERFLARQAFDRFDVTVLIEGADGRWRRGAHGGDRLVYPASCVKLAYLAAAVHWCTAQGRAPDCLDADVRPMIVNSDNVATGRVVDAVSGVANVAWPAADAVPLPGGASSEPAIATPTPPDDFGAWLEKRRYTERLLEAHGLLAGQTLLNKTWPTNSGESPAGYERLSLAVAGRNAMSPDGAARLMLALQSGALVPEGRDHVRSLLRRDRWSGHAAFGGGLPPGARLDAKIGTAYDTVEEIAAIELPDGRRLVIAAFSNGWKPDEPVPYDVAVLGGFADELLRTLSEPAYAVRGVRVAAQPYVAYVGAQPAGPWQRIPARGAFKDGTAWSNAAPGASYEWRIAVPRDGRYELAVWYPAGADRSAAARYEIDGTAVPVYYDQRRWGARWLPLGEVDARGRTVRVQVRSDAEEGALVVDTLRISEVPAPDRVPKASAASAVSSTPPASRASRAPAEQPVSPAR